MHLEQPRAAVAVSHFLASYTAHEHISSGPYVLYLSTCRSVSVSVSALESTLATLCSRLI